MKIKDSVRYGLKFGKGFADLGFKPRMRKPCEKCDSRLVLERKFTGEFYCQKCGWGALWPGTKQRPELTGYFEDR